MKKTCENCYNHVLPTLGVIAPMYECLADDSEYGGENTEAFQQANGKDCPHWHEKMRINGRLSRILPKT